MVFKLGGWQALTRRIGGPVANWLYVRNAAHALEGGRYIYRWSSELRKGQRCRLAGQPDT